MAATQSVPALPGQRKDPHVGVARTTAEDASREPADTSSAKGARRLVRSQRYGLRNALRRVTALDRLRACGAHVVAVSDYVAVHVDRGQARVSGVQTCGSVWACPVCSGVIRERRAEQVEAVMTAALAAGAEVDFVTLTLPHGARDRLDELLRTVAAAWGDVTKGRPWRDAAGLVGFVRAVEITDGWPHGWHPHLHALVIFDRERTPEERTRWREHVTTRWAASVAERLGRQVSAQHGVVIKPVHLNPTTGRADVGEYLAKVQDGMAGVRLDTWSVGREMTRGDLKRGRRHNRHLPFDLAERASQGDVRARARWLEYEAATRGRRCLEWARSDRWKEYLASLDLEPDEDTDEGLAEAGDGGQVVAELTHGEWSLIARYGRQAQLLDAAEDHGLTGVEALLRALRRRERHDAARAARRATSGLP